MGIKFTNIFYLKALQNLPKFGFWFKNKPSGNPAPRDNAEPFFAVCSFTFLAYSSIFSYDPFSYFWRTFFVHAVH
jgi:hypothetical protein